MVDTIRNQLPPDLGSDGGFIEAFISQLEGTAGTVSEERYAPHILTAREIRDVPELQIRFKQYFADWHKLFPFVDGKALRATFDLAVSGLKDRPLEHSIFGGISSGEALVNTAILRAIFTIGGSGRAAPALTPELPVYRDADSATLLAHTLVSACDACLIDHVQAIQGIFAIALSLFYGRWFRPASHLVGTLVSEFRHGAESNSRAGTCRRASPLSQQIPNYLRKRRGL